MYMHVCTMYRALCTKLHILVHVVRIPDAADTAGSIPGLRRRERGGGAASAPCLSESELGRVGVGSRPGDWNLSPAVVAWSARPGESIGWTGCLVLARRLPSQSSGTESCFRKQLVASSSWTPSSLRPGGPPRERGSESCKRPTSPSRKFQSHHAVPPGRLKEIYIEEVAMLSTLLSLHEQRIYQ